MFARNATWLMRLRQKQERAAIRIQKIQRGRVGRRRMGAYRVFCRAKQRAMDITTNELKMEDLVKVGQALCAYCGIFMRFRYDRQPPAMRILISFNIVFNRSIILIIMMMIIFTRNVVIFIRWREYKDMIRRDCVGLTFVGRSYPSVVMSSLLDHYSYCPDDR
jgi:hypothetical protein